MEASVADLDRRLSLLEGWKESQDAFVRSLKDDVREVQSRLTALQTHMDHRFADMENAIALQREELKGDIAELSRRMDAQRDELKGDIAELSRRMDAQRDELKEEMSRLVQRMDTQTRWIVGMQFLTLLTLIGALLRMAG
jgi:chromosome segregation ATPase